MAAERARATRLRRAVRGLAGAAARGLAGAAARGLAGAAARGQGIVEDGLILSGSALLTVVLLVFFSGTVSAVLDAVGDAIDAAS